jgi:hypothetical protein
LRMEYEIIGQPARCWPSPFYLALKAEALSSQTVPLKLLTR